MKMPISEILDRYSIALIKQEKTNFNVKEEVEAYEKEIESYGSDFSEFIETLKSVNKIIWELEESGSRHIDISNFDSDNPQISLEELGKIALKVRKYNKIRNGIKAKIVEKYAEGFQEIPINYEKHHYGQL